MLPKNRKIPLTTSFRRATIPLPTRPGPAAVSRKNSAQNSPMVPLMHAAEEEHADEDGRLLGDEVFQRERDALDVSLDDLRVDLDLALYQPEILGHLGLDPGERAGREGGDVLARARAGAGDDGGGERAERPTAEG